MQDRLGRFATSDRRLGRRAFLRRASTVGLVLPLVAASQWRNEFATLRGEWAPDLRPEAYLSAPDFLAHYESAFRAQGVRIGTSFAPELLGASPSHADRDADALAKRVLAAAVEDLGMTDVRLGLRWSNLAPDTDALNDFYEPYLDYCFASPLVRTVSLDIGPIKTFRWPELHVPQRVLDRLKVTPARGATITPDDELAQISFEHAERTVEYLARRYGGAKPVTFSFNEPFHGYGPQRWMMSPAYLVRMVEIIRASTAFRDACFLVNSAGGADLDQIAAFIDLLRARYPEVRDRLTSGVSMYTFVPPYVWFRRPVLQDILAHIQQPTRNWYGEVAKNLRRARDPERGFPIEITEAQAEPFGPLKQAGDSLAYYQHVLSECMERILNPAQRDTTIRMFGAEYQLARRFAGTATEGNEAILGLTRAINHL